MCNLIFFIIMAETCLHILMPYLNVLNAKNRKVTCKKINKKAIVFTNRNNNSIL